MKPLILAGALLAIAIAALADWREPLTDTAIGKTTTGSGWLIFRHDTRGKPEYMVLVQRDTGLQLVSAVLDSNVVPATVLGRLAVITATVSATEAVGGPQGGASPRRYLRITDVKVKE